jgi:hypothetical protein
MRDNQDGKRLQEIKTVTDLYCHGRIQRAELVVLKIKSVKIS